MNIQKNNPNAYYFLSAVLVTLYLILFLFRNTTLIVDEVDAYPQIINFSKFNFVLLEISAMPGYHAILAFIVWLTGFDSVLFLRAVTLIFGYFSVISFLFILYKTEADYVYIRTIQFATLPVIFIYFYMIYTDILSLLFILLMMLFSYRKYFVIAGIMGILSMLIRQNNIIWISIVPLIYYFDQFGFQISIENIRNTVKKMWVFIVGLALFLIFVFINDGVAIGDSASHPAFKFSTGNLYFFLFCLFILFLPFQIYYLRKVSIYLYQNKWTWITSFLIFVIYWFTFKADHPYNSLVPFYFLRNLILTKINSSDFLKALFFLPVIYSVWTLYLMTLMKKSYYLLYPLTILFLTPLWLIEQRYFIIPITLFLIFRKPLSKSIELIQIVFNILILVLLLPLILSGRAFL